ncbi:MAG: hypothetical protein L0387_29475 [Acidobacteria bacterium]|nr:hypothetical protein [Acidobacteriota bacterium]MCI0719675.1 hypothetical protein [Acidobacteriota bacterium]
MTANAVSDNSEIVVSGKDMFGAPFSEKAHLLYLDQSEFSFSLFRPVAEHQPLRVDFQPEENPSNQCIEGLVVSVKSRLDGMQTVEVKVLNGTNGTA